MGTKVQATAFLPECYHSVIDHTGSTSKSARSVYHHEEGENDCSGHDVEKVRRTIIEHESIFRNQLQELHRLYRRQRELMNGIRKDDSKHKCLPVFTPPRDTRSLRTLEPRFLSSGDFLKGTDEVIGVPCDTYASNNQVSYNRRVELSLTAVPTSHQRSFDALGFDFYSKSTTKTPGDLSVTNQKDRISDELTLSCGANPASGFNLALKDFYRNSVEGMNGKRCTSILGLRNESNGKGHSFECQGIEKERSECSGKPLLAELRKELPHYPYTRTSASRKKKKIFGVEISEVDEYPFNASSNISATLDKKIEPHQENHHIVSFNKPSLRFSSSCMQNIDLARNNMNDSRNVPYELTESEPGKCFKNSVDMNSKPVDFQSNHDNPKNGLPWFLKNSQGSSDLSKGKKNSYIMNLDSLQSYSDKFFRNAETAEGKLHTLKQKTEVIIRSDSARKVELDENAKMKQVKTTNDLLLHTGLNSNSIPNLSRHHIIDLNLSLDDEDASSTSSLPTAVVKIATAETDLEAHSATVPEVSYEECDKFAADAIVDISSLSTRRNLRNEESCNRLKWFADIISLDQNGHDDEVQPVPDGIDDFEIMTLRLEDVKEEQHYHEPVMLKIPITDTLMPKRSRRGRQRRRDFQRDILPGLVTLSRLEVTEDFQTFQQLMKAEGGSQGPTRNGRGRKRLGGQDVSPAAKLLRSGWVDQPVCRPKGRSLTGWGRKTRRLPRQRCASAFIDFSVKC